MKNANAKSFDEKVRENPDSFDFADVPAPRKLDPTYSDAVMPDHIRQALDARQRKPSRAA